MVPSDSNASPERIDPSHPCPTLTDVETAQAIEEVELKAIHKLCRHHKDRAAAWLAGLFVSLPVGGMIAIPARTSTAWGTWLINWQANLILCFAGLCLVMSLCHGARLIHLAVSRKKP